MHSPLCRNVLPLSAARMAFTSAGTIMRMLVDQFKFTVTRSVHEAPTAAAA
jgi:hypothetical protein